ncbi:ATP-binding protein [Streptomyces sp. CAU 1734]|uniref:ATP-binding protein n=1 Tax=Streptomyces sp. CAU 1734 TaxID=3140360 RepID=UPI0032602686
MTTSQDSPEPRENVIAGAVVSRWGRGHRCVGRARAELRDALRAWGLGSIEESALLVLSELLTNAVRHARVSPGREIETRYLLVPGGGGVRIEVHDASDVLPRARDPLPDAVGGWGLPLVAALATVWGVSGREGPGKVVWAELAPAPGPVGTQRAPTPESG